MAAFLLAEWGLGGARPSQDTPRGAFKLTFIIFSMLLFNAYISVYIDPPFFQIYARLSVRENLHNKYLIKREN
jgi:hypothetical protein